MHGIVRRHFPRLLRQAWLYRVQSWLSGTALLSPVTFARRGRFIFCCDCSLEPADALPESFAQFWKFRRSEHEQSNARDDHQVHGLKQTFKHCVLPVVLLRYVRISIVIFERSTTCARRVAPRGGGGRHACWLAAQRPSPDRHFEARSPPCSLVRSLVGQHPRHWPEPSERGRSRAAARRTGSSQSGN